MFPGSDLLKAIILYIFILQAQSEKIENFKLPVYGQNKTFILDKVLENNDRVLLNFWASWCVECIREIDELEKLKKNHEKKKILFVGINAGETQRKIKRFIKKYKFSYLILEDRDRIVSKKLNVKELPTTLVIDRKKRILFNKPRPPGTIP